MDHLELVSSKARLKILQELSRRDMYVSELTEEVGMDGRAARHHLEALEEADVVESYSEGRRRYYRLVAEVRLEISPSPDRRFVVQITDV